MRINWNIPPCFLTEGALDSIAAPEKTTATASEDVQPKQAPSNGEQHVVNTTAQSKVITDIDLNDPELNKAATTIQAEFRNHLKREEAKKNEEEVQVAVVGQDEASPDVLPDLDLDDPELNKAALVIQTNFRTFLSEKNKITEQEPPNETQEKETEVVGDSTEPPTSHSQDPELHKAESTVEISPEAEVSNIDDQVPPQAEVQEASEDKETAVENDPEPSSESQEKAEQEGGTKDPDSQSQPLADEEQPVQTIEAEEEGSSKEAEPQVGGDESKELPETVEESKEEEGGDDDGGGSEVKPAGGDDVGNQENAVESVEQAAAGASGGGDEKETHEVCSYIYVCRSVWRNCSCYNHGSHKCSLGCA